MPNLPALPTAFQRCPARLATAWLVLAMASGSALAGPIRDALEARRAARAEPTAASSFMPPGATLQRDLPYGSDPAQRMDVYLPRPGGAGQPPVVVMVHGGAWRKGDKAHTAVVDNKVAHWVGQGWVLVSINYRMQVGTTPLVQAQDVATALATVQTLAPRWGADAQRLVLVGHSAGAHLAALLAANPALATRYGASPWLGTVSLDSAALDIEEVMGRRHFGFYDEPFGRDPALWRATSPQAQLVAGAPPLLLVCSSQRPDACPAADKFKAKADSLAVRAQVLPMDLSHQHINQNLGLASGSDARYTEAVDAFVRSLAPSLAQHLPAAGR